MRKFRRKTRINLQETDLVSLPVFDGPTTLTFVGSKGTAKTTICKLVCSRLNQMMVDRYDCEPLNVAVCGTKKLALTWGHIIGQCYGHVMNIDVVEAVASKMDSEIEPLMEDWIEDGNDPDDFKIPPELFSFFWFDDIGKDAAFMRHPVMRRIAGESRHFGMYAFYMIQDLMQMTKDLRRGTDILIMMEVDDEGRMKDIHKQFLGAVNISFKSFLSLARQCTNGIGNGLVIYKRAKTNKIEDRLFYYSHDISERPWKVCHTQREYSRRHYVSNRIRRKAVAYKRSDYSSFEIDEEQDDLLTDITLNDADPRQLSKFVGEQFEDDNIRLVKLPGIKEKLKYE